ncbi:UNVERIFIED_ORG: DNA-binding transcriptional MerR regulator [Comamonas terrigena]
MKIGELAKLTGLAPSRIRFYEKSGLLNTIQRQENGYREYGPEALWMLEIISTAQSAGFALDEIRSLLPDSKSGWHHETLLESLQNKVKEIERLQERLANSKSQLLLAIASLKNRPDDLACTDRPQWVLDQLRGEVADSKSQLARRR